METLSLVDKRIDDWLKDCVGEASIKDDLAL